MQVEVTLFGQLADIAGTSKFNLHDIPDTDTLKKTVHELYPEIATISYTIAVNKQIIDKNKVFEGDVNVAFLPPFSGG